MQRGMKGGGSTFKDWMEEQRRMEEGGVEGDASSSESASFLTNPSLTLLMLGQQFSSIGDSVTNQLQELSGAIPSEVGPLSAAFRQRMIYSVYLLMAAVAFASLAVFIGLPTLILRPAKFVTLMTLSTACAASSVIVMQKPSVFFANLLNSGSDKYLPVLAVLCSQLATLYVAIIVHKYVYVVAAGALQILSMLYYLSSFVPGGQKGLVILLKTGFQIASTLLTPVRLCCKQAFRSTVRTILG